MKLKILTAITGLFLLVSEKIFSQNCSVNAGVATTVCGNSTMLLTGNKNGLFATGNLSVWTQVSGPSVTILNASSNSSVPGTHLATVTGFSAGNTYTFRITGSCQDGSSSTQTVNYTVKSVTSANAGPDKAVCPAGPNNLEGNALAVGETGAWTGSASSTPVTAIATPSSPTSSFTAPTIGTNSPTFNNSAGTRTLTWTITNTNGCTSSDQVVITNRSGQSTISAGADQILSNCYTTTQSTTMAATFNGNGTGGQGGVWSIINGPNIPTITTPTSNISTVTNLIQGVYTLRWTVSGPCINGYDEVTITVPAPTQSITNVGNAITNIYCDARTTVVLTRSTPGYSNEIAVWTTVSGPTGTNITNPNSSTASITGLNGSSQYQFKYTITNTVTGCVSTNTTNVQYANNAPIITTGITSTILGCNQTSVSIPYTVTILGSNPTLSTQYQIVSGPRTTPLSTIGTTPQNVSGMTIPGTYTIRLTSIAVTNSSNNTFVYGTCPAGTKDVTATASISPTTANAGSQPAVACNVFSVGLSGNNPTVGTGIWSQVSGPNTATILNPTSATANTVTGMVNGSYVFRWLVSGGPACGSSQDDVAVKVANSVPGVAAAGSDQSVCNSTPVFLTGSAPASGETGTWTVIPTIPAANFSPNINSANLSVSGLSSGVDYAFKWTISNACSTVSDTAYITVSTVAGPAQAIAGPDICRIGAFTSAQMAGNTPSPTGATGQWTQITGPTTAAFVDNTSPTTSVTGLTNGTYKFEWALSRGGCTPTRDTVSVTIAVVSVAGANAGSDVNVCGSSTQLLGNNISTVTGTWSQISGTGGATISNVNLYNTTISGLSSGSYVYRWTLSNGVCPSTYDDVSVNVSIQSSTASVGSDITLCGITLTTLSGNVISNGSGIWSTVGSAPGIATFSNVTSPGATVSGLLTGTYTFRWTASGGPFCSSTSDDIVVNVAANANAGVDQSLCNATTFALNGNSGTTGVWSQVSGPSSSLTSVSGTSANASGSSSGIYTYRYTANSVFGCPSTFDDMVVTASGLGSTPDAGSDQSLCNTTITALSGNTPSFGTGAWSIVTFSGYTAGATILGANLPNATLSGITPGIVGTTVSGTYILQWTISNGSCSSYSDVVRINSYKTPTTANAGADQLNGCSSATTLAGNNPATGVGQWTQITGPNNATITSPILNNSSVTNLTLGGYTFQWSVTNGTCAASTDQVNITITGLPPTIADAGIDQALCNSSVTTLAGNNPVSGTGSWSLVSGPNTPIFVNSLSGITSLTGMVVGTYVLQWTTAYNSCSSTDQVQIVNSALPTTANITSADFSVCPYVIPTITGNAALSGTGQWSKTSGSGTAVFNAPTTTVTSVYGLLPGSYTFQWSITNGNCPSSVANINVTILGNCPPVAKNLTFTGFEDITLNGTITGFSDPDGIIPTVTGGTFTSTNGRPLTIAGINTATGIARVTYSPAPDYFGIDTYTYQVCDQSVCTTAMITFSITGVNDPPVAVNLTFTGTRNIVLNQTITGFSDVETPVSSLVVQLGTTVGHGSLTLSGTGAFTYLPTSNYTGLDSFTYKVSDGTTVSGLATVTLTITGANNPPVAVNLTFTGLEDTAINQTITGFSDIDTPMSSLVVQLVSTVGQGTLTLSGTGAFTYLPSANYNGLDSFTYQVSDGTTVSGIATITLSIVGVNDPPVVVNLTFTGLEDIAINQTITGFSDIDNATSSLIVQSVSGVSHGTLTLSGTGAFTYLPSANYNGLDSFTYRVSDGNTVSGIATITLSIVGVNDPPVAVNLTFTGLEDIAINQTITGFSDIDNATSSLIVQSVSGVSHGTLTVSGTGAFTYLPSANYNGLDSFTYKVSDGTTVSGIATVTLSITGVNDPPVAVNLTFTGLEDIAINQTITGFSDSDNATSSLIVQSVSGVSHGTLTLSGTGAFTYLPSANYNGLDSFTYKVSDGTTVSGIATVTLSITGVNDPPTAIDLNFSGLEDTAIPTSIIGWNDVDGDILTVSITGLPSNGVLSGSGFNRIYTPNANYNGIDSYTYLVKDPGGLTSSIKTVTISITGVNDPPIAINLTFTGLEDIAINQTITGFSDIDNATSSLIVQSVSGVSHGTLTLSGTGAFTYLPSANYNGLDSFTYKVSDGTTVSGIATVTLSITGVNDPPTAINLTFTGLEDTAIPTSITGWNDVDGDILTVSITGLPSNGILSGSGFNRIYTPDANYNGIDTYTYLVQDPGGLTSTIKTVTITITGVNDPPIASNLTFTGIKNNLLTGNITGFSDPDGTTPTVTGGVFILAGAGTVTITGTTVHFSPNNNYVGITTLGYNVCDNFTCTSAVITFKITNTNTAPTAIDLNYTGLEDTAIPTSIVGWNDIDGDMVTVSITGYPANGTVTGSGFDLTYTPNTDYNGIDSYTYQVQDPGGLTSAIKTVTISITGVNDPPIAINLTFTGLEDMAINQTITGFSDIDTPTSSLVVQLGTTTGHGTLTVSGTGAFTYLPSANYNGLDSFTYKVSDGATVSGIATVTLSITGVNDPPIAIDLNFSGLEDMAIPTSIVGWNDIDGDMVTVSITGYPTNGTVTGSGFDLAYIPNTNYNGIDSYTYLVQDPSGLTSNIQTVTITVTGVNDAPTAIDLSFTGLEDTTILTSIVGWNDIDGDMVTVSITGYPANGTVTGSGFDLTYTPNTDYNGIDSYTYLVKDPGGLTSGIQTVTITVTGVNDPPIAINLTFTGLEDTAINQTITGFSDIDNATSSLIVQSVSGVSHGTLTLSGTGAFTYLPSANYNGLDSFTYKVSDGTTVSGIATVTLSITGVNDAPQVNPDSASTIQKAPVDICVLCNDTDIDGTPDISTLTITTGIPASTGILEINTITGIIKYTPANTFTGIATFIYNVCDNGPAPGQCSSAMVTLTVIPRQIQVTASTVCIKDAAYVNYSVTATNFDPTGLPLAMTWADTLGNTITVVSGLSLNGSVLWPGAVVDANGNGIDWPGWIQDADGNWIQGNDGFQSLRPKVNVMFQVNPTYELILNYPPPTALCNTNPPVVVHQPYAPSVTITGLENTMITGSIAGISDLDGTIPTVNANVFTITGGVLTLTGTGSYVFAPNLGFTGITSTTYTVCDVVTTCTSGVITFSITGVNSAPVALNDSTYTNEDVAVSITILGNDFDVDGILMTNLVDLNPATTGIDSYYTSTDGTYTVNTATGVLTFTPVTGFSGVTEVTYIVYDNDGAASNVATVKVTVNPTLPPGVYVPEGFSPNGDGVNDNFVIESNGYKVTLHIYNRWGNKIYSSDNYNGEWKGEANWGLVIRQADDKVVPDGTYFCVIDFNNGQKPIIKFITISR